MVTYLFIFYFSIAMSVSVEMHLFRLLYQARSAQWHAVDPLC